MSASYDHMMVEKLLPAVWFETCAFGMHEENAPPDDMPRAATDPSHANTLFAMLADIRAAWQSAEIPHEERRALFLRYGDGWSLPEIGRHEGVDKSSALRRCKRGAERLAAWLND